MQWIAPLYSQSLRSACQRLLGLGESGHYLVMHNDASPSEIFDALAAQRFSLAEVSAALAVNPNTIGNYVKLNGLKLCSDTAGRGRARQFCLADVHILALVRGLIRLTGSASTAVREAHRLVFGDEDESGCWRVSLDQRHRRRLCTALDRYAHEMFYERGSFAWLDGHHQAGDWFLLSTDAELGFRARRYVPKGADERRHEFGDLLLDHNLARPICAFINVTFLLSRMERALLKAVNARSEQSGAGTSAPVNGSGFPALAHRARHA